MGPASQASEHIAYGWIDHRAVWGTHLDQFRSIWSCLCGLEGTHTKLQKVYPQGKEGPFYFQEYDT